jgi:hypothetical protein
MISKIKLTSFAQIINKTRKSWVSSSFIPVSRQISTIVQRSSNNRSSSFYTQTGILFSILSAGSAAFYLNYYQIKCETEANDSQEDSPTRMGITKLEVKKLIPKARELDENGDNEEALRLYRLIYQVYGRSSKASRKKMVLIGQRIGVLVAQLGKYEAALNWFVRSFDEVTRIDDDKLPFEMYYDITIMQYKTEQYDASTEMLQECLGHIEESNPDDHEHLALMHQQLGFSYFKQGKKAESEKHLTDALEHLNIVKKTNKAILFYACQEFIEFYWNINDLKRTLLFVEQAKLIVQNEEAFNNEYKPLVVDLQSAYLRKYLKELKPNMEKFKLYAMGEVLKEQIGPYHDQAQKRNLPFHKLSAKEKSGETHNLLYW